MLSYVPNFFMSLIFMAGFCVTFALIPFVKRLAHRFDVYSHPGGHSRHNRPVPLLGGVAIYASFALAFLGYMLYLAIFGLPDDEPTLGQMLSLGLGTTWIMLLGAIDDKYALGWAKKLSGEFIGVLILLFGGHTIASATIPGLGLIEFGFWGVPLFVMVVLLITNAINLIDGIDGLAGGVCFFAALVTGVIGLIKGDPFSGVIGFAVSGALVGFLRYNFPPASIFMGDGGSLMLGFLLGTLATSSAAPSAGQRPGALIMILAPFLPFGIALLDVLLSIGRRFIRGQRVFAPDRGHLHHRLMEAIGKPRYVVSILYCFSAALSAMTLTLVLGPEDGFVIGYVILSGIVLLGLVVMVIRLYRTEKIPTILENRPHFQFLDSYMTFMVRRARRAIDEDELISLLKSGIRDLHFDRVRVLHGEDIMQDWVNPIKSHPGEPRQGHIIEFERLGLTIEVVMPTHDSVSYQRYLRLAWDAFLKEMEACLLAMQTAHELAAEIEAEAQAEADDEADRKEQAADAGASES